MRNSIIELKVPLTLEMVPLVTGVARHASRVFGLSKEGINKSVLACEEVFVYLASQSDRSPGLAITIRDGGYYIRVSFSFPPLSLPVDVLNITAVNDPFNTSSHASMGILFASRITDRFILDQGNPDETVISLVIEKQYPDDSGIAVPPLPALLPEFLFCTSGSNEEIKQAVTRLVKVYGRRAPDFFRYPGKVIDMIASGELQAAVYGDGEGNVAGCIMWRPGKHLIELYGPYVFIPGERAGEMLIRSVLESVGRSGEKSLIIRYPTPETPVSWFEEIPAISLDEDTPAISGSVEYQMPLYRQLNEDTGAVVMVHLNLGPAISRWYRQMDLPRQVLSSAPAGESPGKFTVFTVMIDKNLKTAVLSLQKAGRNAPSILTAHLAYLTSQGISEITYEMELKNEKELFISPILIDAGFFPAFIIPWGGAGDILVLRYRKGDQP